LDRLQVSVWINENIKLFASLETNSKRRSIGPWWLEKLTGEEAAVARFAHVYALDFYRSQENAYCGGLDPDHFIIFIEALRGYQDYVIKHHNNPQRDYSEMLKNDGDLFQKIVDEGKASSLVYAYLGSVRSLQNNSDAAIVALEHAVALNTKDVSAAEALKQQRDHKALQPVPVAAAPPGSILNKLREQRLPGYDLAVLSPPLRDITIAVIGTGISPELAKLLGERLVYSSSTVPTEPDGDDRNGHGTAVAALAAALAPSARIISIKCLSQTGAGDDATIAEGIRRATEAKANIILLPLGGAVALKEMEEAVRAALDTGVLVVAAAGNEGSGELSFPARLVGVIATGSVDDNNNIAPFSNRGLDALYAPGMNILTLNQEGKLVERSGTSFSAAIGAAFAAIVWGAKPDLSATQIRELLFRSSVDLGPIDPQKPQVGRLRRIDVPAALRDTG
jgi:subtilisin family serine protease